uniref:Lipoprotein n=1 Tax=Rhizophora mucronata TaxID=61149 RepID=A0A2P2JDN5_RHIMU
MIKNLKEFSLFGIFVSTGCFKNPLRHD